MIVYINSSLRSFALLVFSMMLFGCTQPITVAESVLVDQTEKGASPEPLTGKKLLDLAELGNCIYHGFSLRYGYLTDVRYNRVHRYAVPQANRLFTIKTNRELQVQQAQAVIDSLEQVALLAPHGRQHSHIYAAIVDELHQLTTTQAQRSILIVYNSNLFENTTAVNLYNETDQQLLVDDRDGFAALLEASVETPMPPDLNDTDVHFIYQSTSYEESQLYEAMVYVYKRLIEERGGTVTISANLTTDLL